jgi:predicted Zn-dependent peptidase
MVLKDQIKSLIDNPPDQKLFELSKRKMIGEFLVLCNSISQLGNYAMDYFIKGINPFEFYHALCKMTYDEMQLIRNRLIIDTLVTIEYIPAR